MKGRKGGRQGKEDKEERRWAHMTCTCCSSSGSNFSGSFDWGLEKRRTFTYSLTKRGRTQIWPRHPRQRPTGGYRAGSGGRSAEYAGAQGRRGGVGWGESNERGNRKGIPDFSKADFTSSQTFFGFRTNSTTPLTQLTKLANARRRGGARSYLCHGDCSGQEKVMQTCKRGETRPG